MKMMRTLHKYKERKQRSTVDNLIILNSIIENQRKNKSKTFFCRCQKVFWLTVCERLYHKTVLYRIYPGTLRNLYEINKTSNIVIDTPVGKTSSITVEKVVKQGNIFGPIMCCASTSKVNNRIGSEISVW